MKRTGLLLTLILIARITNAQTDANKTDYQINTEHVKLLGNRSMASDPIYFSTETANGKKTKISSAARKSSLSREENIKNKKAAEKKNTTKNYHSAQARKPPIPGKPPRIALLVIPPEAIRSPVRLSVPKWWSLPSIGKF